MSDLKVCQACGMPMKEEKDFGSNADGSRSEEYCVYCLTDGKPTVICQSCGMPMRDDEAFGKNADGSKNEEYCHYCFQDGKLTNPEMTMEEMIELNVQVEFEVLNEDGTPMTKEEKKAMMRKFLPTLKRWKSE